MSNNNPEVDPASPIDQDAPGRPFLVADSGDTGDGGKLKMIGQLVKRCLGYCCYVRLSFFFFSFGFGVANRCLLNDNAGIFRYLLHFWNLSLTLSIGKTSIGQTYLLC